MNIDHLGYNDVQAGITALVESARSTAARSVNALMTATYWEIGRRIVHFEQGGRERAAYGETLIKRLAADLTKRFGRGFSERNLEQMRHFHLLWPIPQTVSAESGGPNSLTRRFPLPWSAYVRLLSVNDLQARMFYESEALRGGWSVRQLDRQIESRFYERTSRANSKAIPLDSGPPGTGNPSPHEAIKDPFVLEFLNLKDEYSESEVEEAHYALDNLPSTILAARYQTELPDEGRLVKELEQTRLTLETRPRPPPP